MLRERFVLIIASLGLLAVAGCDTRTPPGRDGGTGDGSVGDMCVPGSPGTICEGNVAVQCLDDGSEGTRTNCGETSQVCVPGPGTSCRLCRPGRFQCAGNDIQACSPDGTAWMPHATCDGAAGQTCNASLGVCSSPCEDAARSNSYIGCEYWPTPTANLVDPAFEFAVVVANPQASPASVTVTRGGASVATATVAPGAIETIRLPWVIEYKDPVTATGAPASALVRGGAYRLVSTLPVTVYQFNPLEYELAGDFSFSNDASLLLPSHVMTGNYIAVSERTLALQCDGFLGPGEISASPGFVVVVGVSPTPVMVNVNLRGNVAASVDGAVAAGNAGTTQTYMLGQGDVLQLASAAPTSCTVGGTTAGQCDLGLGDVQHCQVPDQFDLTGTEIRATGPVMVIGGHTCAFMPFNRFACDHLEETVFPLESWGRDFIVSATQPLRGEPNIIRVVSGTDGNNITFDPASAHAPVTLGRGQVVEFETTADFRVTGSGPILVAQFLVGQSYAGTVEMDGAGDPAMSFAIPSEQFRNEYTFLAPSTFERNFVNVTAPVGSTVTLDGTQVSGWRPVGGSGMQTARVEIAGGAHNITSSVGFGIVVYGFGSYTSYMYPGGLNFENINPLI